MSFFSTPTSFLDFLRFFEPGLNFFRALYLIFGFFYFIFLSFFDFFVSLAMVISGIRCRCTEQASLFVEQALHRVLPLGQLGLRDDVFQM